MSKIGEIIERAVEKAVVEHECASDDCTGESEIATEACLAVAKAVVEEAKATFWKGSGYCRVCGLQQELSEKEHIEHCDAFRGIALLGKDGE